MKKVDLKKELKHLYRPTAKEVIQVNVPCMNYLFVDGEGEPGSESYVHAVEALFATSYAVKFAIKRSALETDYGVLPLEGLWWVDDMSTFSTERKSDWKWTMMIMQPEFVTRELINQVVQEVTQKKNPAAIAKLRFDSFTEGNCAQILHVGPFTEEGPTVARVHQFIDARGKRTGKHHEIYLSDIRRANPSNWKTVIRQPFEL